MGLGMDMERDELLEDRAAFIAGEIGGAVVELIIEGVVIDRDSIVDKLEAKRRSVGNVIHNGLLRDAAEFARRGIKNPARWPGGFIRMGDLSVFGGSVAFLHAQFRM